MHAFRGQVFGRPSISDDKVQRLYEALSARQFTPFQIAEKLNLPAFDVYQYLDTGSSKALTEADKYEITQLANVRKYSYKK